MYQTERVKPKQPKTEMEVLKDQLETANKTIQDQDTRMRMMEQDNLEFMNFVLETLGGV